MKVTLATLLVIQVTVSLATLQEVRDEFEAFKLKYNKRYATEKEEQFRFKIFEENFLEYEKHNEQYKTGQQSYSKVINQLSDLREEEWLETFGGCLDDDDIANDDMIPMYKASNKNQELPKNLDWEELGYVTPAKRQKGCGSCWAFSSLRPMEAAYKRKSGNLEVLSAQQLVDCASKNGRGCHGGLIRTGLSYTLEYGGLEKDSDYPYIARERNCTADPQKIVGPVLDSIARVGKMGPDVIKEAIATQGPVTAAVCAKGWPSMGEGIFYDPDLINCGPNHGVSIVGYGTLDDYTAGPIRDYWLLKNSWGEEYSYKIARGVNMINIEDRCLLPVVDGFTPPWEEQNV